MSYRLASDLILRFASPWFLLFLLLVPVLAALPLLASKRLRPSTLRYSDSSLTVDLPLSWRHYLQHVLPILRLLTIIFVIVALARPQSGQDQEVIRGEGVDISLALDISGSMGEPDFDPYTRLEAAKQVIGQFIERREFDRIGLVVFARNAFIQSPPTLDYSALLRLLEEVKLVDELGIQDGTAIGLGLANAASLLRDSEAQSRIVVLLTDGYNNAGQIDPMTAAEAAKALDIKVYTIGAGLLRSGSFASSQPFGAEVLESIADETGGLYFQADDTAGLQEIYDEIDRLEKSNVEVRVYTRYQELAFWFLLPAIVFFAIELLLRQTVLRKIP
ncbi:MAG: VWA domain-containing protein [Chloroflexota bacterium]